MTDSHEFRIRVDKPTKRGHRITYRCSSCDARGDMTLPTREKALQLLALLQSKHGELSTVNTGEAL